MMEVAIQKMPRLKGIKICSIPPLERVIIIPNDSWNDELHGCNPHNKEEKSTLTIDEYVAYGLSWEGLLISLCKIEGWYTPLLLDDMVWKSEDWYDVFKGIHYS